MTFHDRQGNEVTMREWRDITTADDFGLADGGVVTFFRGIGDVPRDGPPLIYETVKLDGHGTIARTLARWATEEQAIAGHHQLVGAE